MHCRWQLVLENFHKKNSRASHLRLPIHLYKLNMLYFFLTIRPISFLYCAPSKAIFSTFLNAFSLASSWVFPVAVTPNTRPPLVTTSPLSFSFVPAWNTTISSNSFVKVENDQPYLTVGRNYFWDAKYDSVAKIAEEDATIPIIDFN